jgi:hypothetical protein
MYHVRGCHLRGRRQFIQLSLEMLLLAPHSDRRWGRMRDRFARWKKRNIMQLIRQTIPRPCMRFEATISLSKGPKFESGITEWVYVLVQSLQSCISALCEKK